MIKVGFQLRFPIYMANIIKVLLFRDETDLACYLTAFYEIQVDELMIQEAIDSDYYKWLNYVWAFRKNYVVEASGHREVNLHDLFDYIINACKKYNESGRTDKHNGMKISQELEKVCKWKLAYHHHEELAEAYKDPDEVIDEDDNILKALLTHMED